MLNRFRFFVVEEVVVAALCDGCAVRARVVFMWLVFRGGPVLCLLVCSVG